MVTRRDLLFQIAAASSTPRRIALTMDDFHWRFLGSTEAEVLAKNRSLLKLLERENLQAAAFFIGGNIEAPIGRKVLDAWGASGHLVANHTWSHRNYNAATTTFEFFSADTARTHAVLEKSRGFTPLLRFPALKEGETLAKRDAMRAWMKSAGYRNGHVAIDTSDWLYAAEFAKRLAASPRYESAPFRGAYLSHLRRMGEVYGGLARELSFSDAPLTLLVHYNELNVRHLADVLQSFRSAGWQWVGAREAFRHALYSHEADTLPAGESLIWALARQTGHYEERLRHQGEQDKLEESLISKLP